jgi:hypothetical protein
MISPRTLALVGGCLALLSVAAVAQPAVDGDPRGAQEAPAAAPQKQPDAPRPASAVPPERIQVEAAPGARPQPPPRDDPRSVEEDKGEPDAADR